MSGETITLPLDVVREWVERARPLKWPTDNPLVRAIDAALWKPEPGIAYRASEHRPPDEQIVLAWMGGYWASFHGKHLKDDEHWMLQPPAPEVQA